MKRKRPTMIKADWEFKRKLERIKYDRVTSGLDDKPASLQELTFRMTRFEPLWDVLKKAKFVKDKKGSLNTNAQFSILTFGAVAFLAVVFLAGLIYVTGLLNDNFTEIGRLNEGNSGQPGYVNLTEASNNTFGQMNLGIQSLRVIAFIIIFSQILLMVVITGFSSKHPVLFIAWIFIVFLAVMFSAPISNAYESLVQSGVYGGILESFTGANWILLNLPLVTLFVGILGGILMFVNILRGGGEESLI